MSNVISRTAAAGLGELKYFTGKPCKNGHVADRYVQSGTCSACIRAATTAARRNLEDALHTVSPAAREHVVDLAELRIRAYAEDAATVRDIAAAYCLAVYPTLTRDDVHIHAPPTDATGGTALYRVRVPLAHAQLLRDTANAMLNARGVSLAGFHASQIERADAMAREATPAAPAWRFQ